MTERPDDDAPDEPTPDGDDESAATDDAGPPEADASTGAGGAGVDDDADVERADGDDADIDDEATDAEADGEGKDADTDDADGEAGGADPDADADITDAGDADAEGREGDAGDADADDTDAGDGDDVDEAADDGGVTDDPPKRALAKGATPPRPSTSKKSSPPPRPRKDSASGRGPRASRKARRRKVGVEEIGLVVALGLLIARAVTMVTHGAAPSGWAWITLAVVVGAVVVAGRAVLDKRGRLQPLRGRGLGALVAVLALAAFSLTTVLVTRATPQLGLDLQGGFSVTLTAEGDVPGENIDQAISIIRNRIDALGVAEPEVTRQGDSVVVDMPGIDDRERALEILGETAQLEFRPVLAEGVAAYDAAAAEAGDDPCVAPAAGAPAGEEAPADESVPAGDEGPGESVPAEDAPAESVPAEEAPASTEGEAAPRPAPVPGVVADGEVAAPLLGRQDGEGDPAPDTTAPDATEPTPSESLPDDVPVESLPEDLPAEVPAEEPATDTIIIPNRPIAGEEPVACTEVGPVGFGGDALSNAEAVLGGATGSEWVVSVSVKGSERETANALINACAAAQPTCPTTQMAIVLDGEVISAPRTQSPNLADDDFQISGGGQSGFPESEAKDLALKLRYGALPVEFTRGAGQQISPTVGSDSLRAGIMAGLAGLAIVMVYLFLYYRALALVVLLGMGVWSVLMYGLVSWLSATQGLTLSLSGVVGIVISIGTTVDSYVVHFERLKDEVRLGKSVRSSTEKGFRLAFRTILTANVAALIGAALLWWLTVGAVRGFAFFLGLSVLLDLFVIWTFERPMVALFGRSEFFTGHRIFGVARGLGSVRSAPEGARS